MIRPAAVAGTFYPGDRHELGAMLESMIPTREERIEALGVVVPHAGYIFSGAVAGETYAGVKLPRKYIILCPNHTGMGAPISIMSSGQWETPLGSVSIDSALAARIKDFTEVVRESPAAHIREHALEVHLPFLQFSLGRDFQFVPIAVGTRDYESLADLGEAMGRAIAEGPDPVLMISSSDMNHFESAAITEMKDQIAIEKILALDAPGLNEVVEREQISMCGAGPTASVIVAARQLGATRAKLVRHAHSGQITGDRASVVGYAGLVIY